MDSMFGCFRVFSARRCARALYIASQVINFETTEQTCPQKGPVTSGSLWGHRARPELGSGSLRGHFGITWLKKLSSGSLRGHLAQETLARSHFGATWLGRTRLEVTSILTRETRLEVTSGPHLDVSSKSLRSHLAREDSSRGHFEVSKLCTKLFETTVAVPLNSEALSSAPPRTEDGYPRVHSSIIYIYIYIYYVYVLVYLFFVTLYTRLPRIEVPVFQVGVYYDLFVFRTQC